MTKPIHKLFASVAVALAGGAASVIIMLASSMEKRFADLSAGWIIALFVLIAGHAYLRWSRRQTGRAAIPMAAALSFIRLLVLLIVVLVVNFGGFFRTGPFLAGLMPVYFLGIWAEIAWLASPPAPQPYCKD
jgi:hypothetical protein